MMTLLQNIQGSILVRRRTGAPHTLERETLNNMLPS